MDSANENGAQPLKDYEQHVDKCLSLIMHHEEVQKIAEVIKKIYAEMHEQEDPPDAI